MQAAANAQQVSGAAVQFHPGKNQESPFKIMRVFQEEGGRADKAILCHTESEFKVEFDSSILANSIFNAVFQEPLTRWIV